MNLTIGNATLTPQIEHGTLRSLGAVTINGVALRNPAVPWLPWFDSYAGGVFASFRDPRVETRGAATVLRLRAVADVDYPFLERRDSSGDLIVRSGAWGTAAGEGELRVVFEPATADVDGRQFTGFRYWYEWESTTTPIHRLLDRQTWELGGNLDDVTVVCRNLFDLPKKRVTRDGSFSTVGLNHANGLLPGHLWARWSLLPAFDLQAGTAGIWTAWFDEVSLVRTVIESTPGENWVRYGDFHYFEQAHIARTNPRTILHCPDRVDDVELLNLWTRLHDQELAKAQRQFGFTESPPPIVLGHNVWRHIRFGTTYERVVDVAAEVGAELVFIDSVFQNGETIRDHCEHLIPPEQQRGMALEKFSHGHMCLTLDFEVSETAGGEAGLKALCDRAAAKGVGIMSWMSTHLWPNTVLGRDSDWRAKLGQGSFGIYAARESGHHPDSGYALDCWPVNAHAPIWERLRGQLRGVCERTGLRGYLWDSFSNLGWWQVDYSGGTMRPACGKVMELFAELTRAGLYIQPEAICSFTGQSACGLFGGNVYAGDLAGYAYRTVIGLHYGEADSAPEDHAAAVLRGHAPFRLLFECYAHLRIVSVPFHVVPRKEWDTTAAAKIRDLFTAYKNVRHLMQQRTVLPDGRGVLWTNDGSETVLFAFTAQPRQGEAFDAATGCTITESTLAPERVYRLRAAPTVATTPVPFNP